MDKLAQYRQIIKDTILKYAQYRPSHGDIRLDPVLDEQRDNYALMQVGWDRGKRVRGNLIYITLKQEKVYIEYDGIEMGITQDLLEQGIVEADIVYAFQQSAVSSQQSAVSSQQLAVSSQQSAVS